MLWGIDLIKRRAMLIFVVNQVIFKTLKSPYFQSSYNPKIRQIKVQIRSPAGFHHAEPYK
ncbi:hypothetical protein DIU36_00130 [Mucilaginibacter rubeus]|nr:hypothetical protein DIU36_00130 [Mucilaginibacter rubeus]